jgi:hypothetical protein
MLFAGWRWETKGCDGGIDEAVMHDGRGWITKIQPNCLGQGAYR